MTMEEAEAFFKSYLGNGYLMWHEDIPGEAAFRALNLPEETLQAWRQDILEEEVAKATAEGGKVWTHLSAAIDVLRDMRQSTPENHRMVIAALRGALAADAAQRTILLESVVGRTASGNDGLLALTREREPQLLGELLEVADVLADSLDEAAREASEAQETAPETPETPETPEVPSADAWPWNPLDFRPSFNPERAQRVVENYRSKARRLRQ